MPDRRFLSPLINKPFRNIWIASIASNLGGLIQGVGAAWMMTSITTSENMVALVQACTTLPIMLFSLVAGAFADSYNRKTVMLLAQLFMLVASTLLAVTAFLDGITPWILLLFTFLIGCGTALNAPSLQASVGDMVPREDVAGAVSLNSMGFNLTRSVGPAIGGAIVAFGGAGAAFAVNAASYLPLMAALLRWKVPPPENTLPREEIGQAIVAGIRYMSMSPNLIKVFTRSFIFGFSTVAVLALLPIVALEKLGGGPLTFGLLLGSFGLGAVIAAYFNAWLRERVTSEHIVRGAFIGFAVSEVAIAWTSNALTIGAAMILAGACWVIALSLFNTIVQLSTPRWVVGRALSIYQTATFGGLAAGSWLWGSLAESSGTSTAFWIAAVCVTSGALIGMFLPMPVFASLNLDPLDLFREPELQLEIVPRSGPIVIQVSYQIRDDDLTEFLTLMAERRRIRIRDGAQAWALMRDLEDPHQWTETYHTPTWLDYVRHNIRRTKADAENLRRIQALHRGDLPPRIQRMIERQIIPPVGDVFHQSQIDNH
jgi:MFS family permease